MIYRQLVASASLLLHCQDVQDRAGDMLETLMKQIANSEGITEKLKINDQMAWVGAINNVKNQAEEIVLQEVIYNV